MYVHSYAVCVLMWWLLLFPASTDVDECVVDNGGCEHGCVNTIGSRLCTCHHGYALNSDESAVMSQVRSSHGLHSVHMYVHICSTNSTCVCMTWYVRVTYCSCVHTYVHMYVRMYICTYLCTYIQYAHLCTLHILLCVYLFIICLIV